jgi:hypothetical protein
MKYFLAQFRLFDGDHEHRTHFLVNAKNMAEARKIAIEEGHDPEGDKEEAYFSFGDGQTACRLETVEEIKKAEAEALDRLGVAYFVN